MAAKQTQPQRIRRDFKEWVKEFELKITRRSPAAIGLKKWIEHEKAARASIKASFEQLYKHEGRDPSSIKGLSAPEDAPADVRRWLYRDSIPNVEERTRAAKDDKLILKQMEKLAADADKLVSRLETRGGNLSTQDGFFQIPMAKLLENSRQLSSSIRTASRLVKRSHIYPVRIVDCCIALFIELEDSCGLTQRESHDLIRLALLAHGCSDAEAAQFNPERAKDSTVGYKKDAVKKQVIDSANILSAIIRKS